MSTESTSLLKAGAAAHSEGVSMDVRDPGGDVVGVDLAAKSQITTHGAAFNLMNYVIGVGIVGLPYAFAKAGIAMGIVLLLVCCAATVGSFNLLLWASHLTDCMSYEKLAKFATGGTRLSTAVKVLIIVDTFGSLSAYLRVVGDSFHDFAFQHWPESPGWLIDGRMLTFLCILIFLVPLSFVRNLDSIGWASGVSLLPIVYLLILQATYLARDGRAAGSDPVVAVESGTGFFLALPIVVFSFSSHQALFPIYEDIKRRGGTLSHVNQVVRGGFALSLLLYFLCALLGYLQFTSAAKGNVLTNYPPTPAVDILLVSFSMSVIVGYPIVMFACRLSLDRLLGNADAEDPPKRRFVLQNLCIIAMAFAIGVLVPSFAAILGLFGSFTKTLLGFALPAYFFLAALRRRRRQSDPEQQGLHAEPWKSRLAWTIGVVGSAAGATSFVLVVRSFFSG